jgi:hypothetical protein
MEPTQVFISYTRDDRALVEFCVSQLRHISLRFNYDKDIPAGEKWEDWIDEEITNSDALLVLLTPNSIKSPHVIYEASFAIGAQVPVYPVMFGRCDVDKLNFRLSSLQLQTYSPEDQSFWNTLQRRLLNAKPSVSELRRLYRRLYERISFDDVYRSDRSGKAFLQSITAYAAIHSMRSIHFEKDVLVEANQWAYTIMEAVWDELIAWQQSRLSKSISENLFVYALHRSPTNFWCRREANSVLNKQQQFIDGGGRICRILLLDKETNIYNDEVRQSMDLMEQRGIDVFCTEGSGENMSGILWAPRLRISFNYGKINFDDELDAKVSYLDKVESLRLNQHFRAYMEHARNRNSKTPLDLGYNIADNL